MNNVIRRQVRHCAQRGISLLFALLALAAMSLAAVALVRSVDTGTQVLGNLGFKQDATSASSRATEAAITWIQANPTALDADNPAAGYYASSLEALDPTGRVTTAATPLAVVNWGDADSCSCVSGGTCSTCAHLPFTGLAADANGNRSRYLISRMCQQAAPISATNLCAKPAKSALTNASDKSDVNSNTAIRISTLQTGPYYRIVVRTVGARNTASFTETIVHF